jgi:hypothetical protein
MIDLMGTAEEMDELLEVLVRDCGCGCTHADRELVSPGAECAAVRALSDRRFVLGMLFARRLRHQLQAEEWTRSRLPARARPVA